MSLINDALKRASETERSSRPSGPLGVPLQPVHTTPGPSWLGVVALPLFLVTVLSLGVWLIVSWWNARQKTEVSVPAPAAPVAQPAQPPVNTPKSAPKTVETAKTGTPSVPVITGQLPPLPPPPVPQITSEPVTSVPSVPPRAPAVAVEPVPVPPKPVAVSSETVSVRPPEPPAPANTVPTPPAKPTYPALKVQGIFYSKRNPSALINGKPVFIGDKVDGAVIVAIEARSVTFDFNGEKKVISMD